MKLIGFLNGWAEAPHCWKTFACRPFRVERTVAWTSVEVFGFVFFFGR